MDARSTRHSATRGEARPTPDPRRESATFEFSSRLPRKLHCTWRGHHRQSRLADSGRLFLAQYDVNFCFRSLADTRQLIIVEIRLLHTASLDGNGVVQSGGKAVDGRAFHLRANAFRIDGTAAVHGINETVQLHGAVFHASFGHRRRVGIEGIKCSNASSLAFWQGLSPASFL